MPSSRPDSDSPIGSLHSDRMEIRRLRDALHTICGLTHQDIDEEPFWRLVSRIHHVARAAVDPPVKESS